MNKLADMVFAFLMAIITYAPTVGVINGLYQTKPLMVIIFAWGYVGLWVMVTWKIIER